MSYGNSAVREIKRAQKESLLFKEISKLVAQLQLEEPRLQTLFVNRVSLSDDKGACSVYFYSLDGQGAFQTLLPLLILYKPSIRKSISQAIKGRYTPELVFKFDDKFTKQHQLEELLDTVTKEGSSKQ